MQPTRRGFFGALAALVLARHLPVTATPEADAIWKVATAESVSWFITEDGRQWREVNGEVSVSEDDGATWTVMEST